MTIRTTGPIGGENSLDFRVDREGQLPWRWLGATYLVLGAGLLILSMLGNAESSADVELIALQSILSIYFTTRLAAIIWKGEFRPLVGTFWLFCLTALGVAPLAQAIVDQHLMLQDPIYLFPTIIIVAAGAISFDIAYSSGVSRLKPNETSKVAIFDPKRMKVLVAFGLAASAFYVATIGLANLFSSRGDVNGAIQTSAYSSDGTTALSGILVAAGQVPVFVAFVYYTIVLYLGRSGCNSLRLKLLWMLLFGVNVIVNNPISNPRNWIVTVVLGFLFALPMMKAKHFSWILAGGAVAALVLFPYSDYFRVQSQYRKPLEVRSVVQTLASKDYDQMIMIANSMWWVDRRGAHTYGEQILGALFFFVPRPLWPDKPIDTGVELGRAMSSSNVNLSSPLWAEFWVDFGLLGVVIGFACVGFAFRRGDEIFLDPRSRSSLAGVRIAVVAIPILSSYEFIVLRGPLLQSMARLAVLTVIFYLVREGGVQVTKRRRSQSTQESL